MAIKTVQDGQKAGDAFAAINQSIRTSNSMRRSNVMTKRIFGRYRTIAAVATPMTYHIVMEMPTHFMDVSIGIPNWTNTAIAGVKVSVAVKDKFSTEDPAGSWLNETSIVGLWYNLTFNGAASATLLAGNNTDEGLAVTWMDPIPLQSVARTDESGTRTRPLLVVRVEFPANAVITVPYGDVYYWSSIDAYTNHRLQSSKQAVAGVTDKAAYTRQNNDNTDVHIPMVRYTARKAGIQVYIAGDSTVEGTGAQVRAYSAVVRACHERSTVDNPIEVYNGAINGATADMFTRHLAKHIGDVKPNVVFLMGFSTNDGMDAGSIYRAWGSVGRALRAIRELAKPPLVYLLGTNPKNPASRKYGADDAMRRTFNAQLAEFTEALSVPNYVELVTGTRTAEGQDQIKDGYSNDNVHLNDVGYDAQKLSIIAVLDTI